MNSLVSTVESCLVLRFFIFAKDPGTTVAAFWTVWQIEKIVHKKKVPNPYLTQYTTLCLSWVDSGEHFGSSNLHALTMATWSIWNSWMFMHQRTSWNISMRCHTASPLMLQKFRCRHCQNNQSKASIFQSSNGGVEKDALAQLKRRQHRQHLDSNVKYMYWRFHLQGSLTKKLWSEACQSLGWNKSRRSYLALLMQKKGLNVSYALYMICMYKKLLNKW